LNWAGTAWQYYQPGVGVNSATGLQRANLAWPCSTDWDFGGYIYAVIFARRLDLISDGSGSRDWQFNDRVNRLLDWLQTRPLNGSRPYRAYEWSTGGACSDTGSALSDSADQGIILSALHALTVFRPSYSSQVASIFARSQPAYATLYKELGTDYYDYLIAEGYAAFGYNESNVFNAIDNYKGPFLNVYGQSLPLMKTGAEPLNQLILEGDYQVHPSSPAFHDFANRVRLVQAGRFASTNLLTAWSEGDYQKPYYLYEWIIVNTGTWKTWVLTDATASTTYNVQPVAYTKVAFSYLAIYGENSYTLALVNAAKQLASSQGFGEATFENGASAIGAWGSNSGGFYSDKTNEFILGAAAYARSQTTFASTSLVGYSYSTDVTSTTAIPETLNLVYVGIIIAVVVCLMSRPSKKEMPERMIDLSLF
jgi:hypothetical protein